MLRLVGAVYKRFRERQHPHLCAFVVLFDNSHIPGENAEPVRVLRAEWLA